MWNKVMLAGATLSILTLTTPTADAAHADLEHIYQMADNSSETVQEVATQHYVNSAFVPGHTQVDAYNDVRVNDVTPRDREIFIVTDWTGDSSHSAALWWTKINGVINEQGICDEIIYGGVGFCLIPNVPTGRTIFYQAATCPGASGSQLVCNHFTDYTMESPRTSFTAS